MIIVYTSDKIYVDKSKIKNAGRGVFALSEIKKGELVERCPFIEISESDSHVLNNSSLVTYIFYYGKNKENLAIALGFGSIYNHAFNANIYFKIKSKEKLIDFIAQKNIKHGDELTFNYSGKDTSINLLRPMWFEV